MRDGIWATWPRSPSSHASFHGGGAVPAQDAATQEPASGAPPPAQPLVSDPSACRPAGARPASAARVDRGSPPRKLPTLVALPDGTRPQQTMGGAELLGPALGGACRAWSGRTRVPPRQTIPAFPPCRARLRTGVAGAVHRAGSLAEHQLSGNSCAPPKPLPHAGGRGGRHCSRDQGRCRSGGRRSGGRCAGSAVRPRSPRPTRPAR